MSLGTITTTDTTGAVPSAPCFIDRISFAGDAAYPTGGTVGFQALFNAKTKDTRKPLAVITQKSDGDYYVTYDEANDKLIAYRVTTHAEAANAADLSGVTFQVVVISQ